MASIPNQRRVELKINLPKNKLRIIKNGSKQPEFPTQTNPELGIDIEADYFTIPNEPFAGLARILNVENISRKKINVSVLDGTPLIIPYGVSNFFLQKMRRTIEAWMLVENLDKKAPFYRLKVDPKDSSEVVFIKEGNFYIASSSKDRGKREQASTRPD